MTDVQFNEAMSSFQQIDTPSALCEYRCAHCGKIVSRHSDKHWIKSYCEETGKMTRLILISR